MRTINSPEECPKDRTFTGCSFCSEGTLILQNQKGETVSFDVRRCYDESTYRDIIKCSGLLGKELLQTFERADIDRYNRNLFTYLAQEWEPRKGGGVYIKSGVSETNPKGNGTGKTYALTALVHRIARMGIPTLFTRTVDLFVDLRASYDYGNRDQEVGILRNHKSIPVLMLDDLGKELIRKDSDWAQEKLYYIIDYRVKMNLPTFITSNLSLSELEDKYGPNFGPAICSRLAGYCELWSLGGPDRRLLHTAG